MVCLFLYLLMYVHIGVQEHYIHKIMEVRGEYNVSCSIACHLIF